MKFGQPIHVSNLEYELMGIEGVRSIGHVTITQDYDYFYHVLLTQYRQLIWETPVGLIPLREDGTFIHCKTPCLDRDNWKRKRADMDWSKHLIRCSYDPIIFKTFHDFFMKPEQPTLCNFFSD